MNGKAIGETIEDVASSISNSKWAKSIIPTVDELNKTIASNSKLSNSLHTENIQKKFIKYVSRYKYTRRRSYKNG